MNLGKLVETIKSTLELDIKARDDDHRLECIIYSKYIDLKETNVYDFYSKLMNNKIPKASTIRRARRKCQECYPDTRGNKYNNRQESQKQIKEELHDAKLNSSNPGWY